ncbi:hypothetical protein LMH87_007163 [Akanthomyces muscarius]|uniref:Uncharacterized protein n=1 Tax=Akanthomyces muscarius TaxID=2231603 RepID=A0A9W8UTR2_AKAMU|nr:hypothetical protein LMH87_007163 [Akanthomyces muscarius]KAJ4165533.1 hypothetical protein LMH87_007163 [Akanthomyces muscarius]
MELKGHHTDRPNPHPHISPAMKNKAPQKAKREQKNARRTPPTSWLLIPLPSSPSIFPFSSFLLQPKQPIHNYSSTLLTSVVHSFTTTSKAFALVTL